MFYNRTSILTMQEFYVKIDNQAFMFIHVVEQVQAFQMRVARYECFSFWVRNRERGRGRCSESNSLDPAHKLRSTVD